MRVRHSQAGMGGAGFGDTGIGELRIEAVGARARDNSDMHLCAATGQSRDRAATAQHFIIGMRRDHQCVPDAFQHLHSVPPPSRACMRSEEHTSELQSLMRISYAVFCLKKKTTLHIPNTTISYP